MKLNVRLQENYVCFFGVLFKICMFKMVVPESIMDLNPRASSSDDWLASQIGVSVRGAPCPAACVGYLDDRESSHGISSADFPRLTYH